MAGRTAVGLDIATSAVRAVELSLGRHGPRLERFGQVPLPTGAVHDGEVVDVAAVAAAVRQLWSGAKLRGKKVAIGVANQRVIVRQVDLPWLPVDELRASLGFQVQDFIPMPVADALLDFHPLEELTADNGARMIRVLLVAADAGMVRRTVAAVQAAGLTPVGVDLTPFAVLRSLATVSAEDGSPPLTEAIVDVGSSVTNILVHTAGRPRFVRILLLGGDDITVALAERLGVPHEVAEEHKRALSMVPAQRAAAATVTDPGERAVELSASAFLDEIRSSLDYYLAQPGATPLSRLLLTGRGATLGNLAERLGALTRLPVLWADPVAGMHPERTGLSDQQLAALVPVSAVPVGLALGVAS